MRRPADTELYLGYSERELAESPYARFFRPELAPLSAHVREALATGPVAWSLMPGVDRAADLQKPGYELVETGYTTCPDGSARISVLTPMPGVTPAMWDWWFAWHGSEAQRYKLRFLASPARKWQRTSLLALSCYAPGLVEIA